LIASIIKKLYNLNNKNYIPIDSNQVLDKSLDYYVLSFKNEITI